MWFVSQSPQDFAPKSSEEGEGRETITGQCSTIEFFRTPELQDNIGKRFGLNNRQMDFVRQKATPGSAGRGFSHGLMSFSDIPGWMRVQVSASMLEDAVLTYDPRDHGEFAPYLERNTGIESASGVGADHSGNEDATPEVDLNIDGEIGAGPNASDAPADQSETPTAYAADSPAQASGATETGGQAQATANGGTPQSQQQQQSQGQAAAPTSAQADTGEATTATTATTAGPEQDGSEDAAAGGTTENGHFDPHMSIHALDTISEERAEELELRNMGKVGDLMNNDPEVIADASGASIGEVGKYMQEITGKDPRQFIPENRENPYPELGASEMNNGPAMDASNMETGPGDPDLPDND